MPLIKLKEIGQDTWLRGGGGPSKSGVCYYMCDYVEGRSGPWNKPETFAKAVEAARNFGAGTAMMNYAKNRSLASEKQTGNYQAVNGDLAGNQTYRAELWVGDSGKFKGDPPNHEILIVTGPTPNQIIYFEPNFGFYQVQPHNVTNGRVSLEQEIEGQYRGHSLTVRGFRYLPV